jgi:EmrB/QacA subfamily drug resistance transporter
MKDQIRKYLPIILTTAIFMQMLDSTILNTALPAMARDLNESPLNMQVAIISYILTLAICIPLSGYLADRFGTKNVFIWALIIFSVGSGLCAASGSLLTLTMSRVVQGIGGALMTPVARLALLKTFEKSEVVVAMNFAIVPALIGPILGPLVGGYLVEYVSWHWIFLINIPFGILGIILSLKYMPNYKDVEQHFDLKGFLIFAAASVLLSVSLEFVGAPKMLSPMLIGLIFAVLLLLWYFRYAQKEKEPLFPLNLFQIRTFRIGIIGNIATRLGISSLPLLIPLMIQVVYQQSATTAGWMVAPLAVAALLNKPIVLPIINKVGYRRILFVNTIAIGIMILLFAVPGLTTNIYYFVPLTFLLGWFNSTQFTSMNSIGIADLRTYNTSSGNSLLAVNQQLSVGFGIAVGLAILRMYETNLGSSIEATHTAFRYTFITVGLITICSSLVFLRLHKKDGDNLRKH